MTLRFMGLEENVKSLCRTPGPMTPNTDLPSTVFGIAEHEAKAWFQNRERGE